MLSPPCVFSCADVWAIAVKAELLPLSTSEVIKSTSEIFEPARQHAVTGASIAGLMIAAAILIFSPLLEGGTTHVAVMVIRLMILGLAGMAVYRMLVCQEITFTRYRLAMPIMAFLLLAFCSVMFSAYTHHSTQWLMVLVSYAMFLYLLVLFIARWEHVAILLGIVVAMGCTETLLTITQVRQGSVRPSGTFFNPNFLAGYLVAAWTLTLSFLSYQSIRRTRDQLLHGQKRALVIWLLIPICVTAALTVAIVWTGSRGGLLAAAIGSSVVMGFRFGRRGLVLSLILFLFGLAVIPNPLHERLYAEHALNPVTYARWEMWKGAVQNMVDHPLGIGLGLYQYMFPQYAFPVESQIARYGTVAQTPHNEFLQIGVELGAASVLIVGWGAWILLKEIKWILNQRLTRFQRRLLVGVIGGIAGLLAHAAVDSNLHEPALALVLMLFIGIVVASRKLLGGQTGSQMSSPLRHRPIWMAGAWLVLGLLGVIVLQTGVAWIWYESGTALMKKDDVVGALKHYETAVVIDPGKALYHSALAAANFHLFERHADLPAAYLAVDELNKAIMLNPLDGRLAGLLGKAYLKIASVSTVQLEERHAVLVRAEQAYERAIRSEPFNAVHYWEAGQVSIKLGNRHEAEALIKRAVDLEPNFLPGREWLARLYWEKGQRRLVQEEYHEIVERQNRYRDWRKSPLEQQFLTADPGTLAALLSQTGGES